MKQTFEEFIEVIKTSCKKCPWAKKKDIVGYCHELKKESEEVTEAIEKKDNDNLKEELGDVLISWAHICILAEEKKLFRVKDVIKGATDKINRRKPFMSVQFNPEANPGPNDTNYRFKEVAEPIKIGGI